MNDDAKKLLAMNQPQEAGTIEIDRQVHAARFDPAGKMLVAGGFEGEVRRIDVSGEEPNELPHLEGHGGWVQALAFHPSEPLLLSGDSWGQLRAWKYQQESPTAVWNANDAHDGWLREIAVSPDGKLAATCGADRRVRLWSVLDGKPVRDVADYGRDIFCVQFHRTTGTLLTGDDRGVVKQWNADSGEAIREFDASGLYLYHRIQDVGGVRAMAFDADGKTLAVAGTTPKNGGTVQGEPTILLFDFDSGELRHTIKIGSATHCYVHDVCFHERGFVTAVTSGTPGSGQLAFHRPGDAEPFFLSTKMPNCHSISFHPNRRRFAVATTNRGSNGNGRRLDKDGKYVGNTSPVYLFELPEA